MLQVDVTPELESCAVPILDLRGKRDAVVWRHNARTIARTQHPVQAEVIEAPHMLLQTQPAAAAAILERFVASLSARGG